MSIASPLAPPAPARAHASRRVASLWSLPVAVSLGCALVLAMTAGKAVAVWTTGVFLNPDDAMRAVEVRDLLAGQGWFDLVQHRLAPGHGVPMHWSRLADLPIAGLIILFRSVVDPDAAERLARLIEPAILFVGFMIGMAKLGRGLLGERGALAACLLAAGGLDTVGVFIPGHIHHHGLQVMLMVALAALVVEGVGQPAHRARHCGLAGAIAALTLAINLQNLPFVVVAAAALGLGWMLRGRDFDAALRAFAGALMAGSAIVFLLQVPPAQFLTGTCDAFGAPHLLACWLGGAGLLALSMLTPRLPGPWCRAGAGACLGVALLLALRASYPACLGDPYAGVDPLLRVRWLAEVSEAMPLAELLRRDPAGTLPIAAALALGLVAAAAALWCEAGALRARWAAVVAFGLAGAAGTLWEIRVAASAEAFAALGVAWALCRWFDPARPRKPLAALLSVVAGLGLTQAGWTAALPVLFGTGHPGTISAGPPVDAAACMTPDAFAGLAALPQGLVLSTIDPGSQILAYTHHTVLAAPYHRNAYGNLLSLRALDADAATAHAMLMEAGVRYVALCLTSPEVAEDRALASGGLAARLAAGDVPAWLRPMANDGPVRVYQVVP